MIKIKNNNRFVKLTQVLDKIIENYKPPGIVMGKSNSNPKLELEDLQEIIKNQKDIVVATNVYGYFIPKDKYENVLWEVAKGLFPSSELVSVSGRFHYPAIKDNIPSYMGWHTNSNMEGMRVYATKVKEGKKSFFRYFTNNKLYTEWEEEGWNFRAFKVDKNNLYWHCVYSETDRYSFGLRYK